MHRFNFILTMPFGQSRPLRPIYPSHKVAIARLPPQLTTQRPLATLLLTCSAARYPKTAAGGAMIHPTDCIAKKSGH